MEDRVVLFAGDPKIPRKNYAFAAAVCHRTARDINGLRLHVASGVPPNVMPLYMSAADALLLTSMSEGSPNVVKEAMACELPVVSVPVGDIEERLYGVDGCYVASPETESMSGALAAALAHGRSPAAREAVAVISLDNVARRVLDVYLEALGHS